MSTLTKQISFYKKQFHKTGVDISLQDFLDSVAIGGSGGEWISQVQAVRTEPDPAKKKALKDELPCATIAGIFNQKTESGIREFSGVMAMDFDKLGDRMGEAVSQLKADPYTFAGFLSCGGNGYCALVKVQPERWGEAFVGLEYYYLTKYGLVVDKQCKNVNRLRYVSYDPDLYINEKAILFKDYLKPKEQKRINSPAPTAIHTKDTFQYVLDQINGKGVDITGDYEQWYKIGWALIAEFGEAACDIFHQVSQHAHSYNYEEAERKFRYLSGTRPHSITIATFYYYAKLAGLEIMSPRVKEIARMAQMGKRQHTNEEGVASTLKKMMGIPEEESAPVIAQVFQSRQEIESDESLFEQLELFIKANYQLRRNEITRFIEDSGEPLTEEGVNDIYIAAAKTFDMKVSKANVEALLYSNFVVTFNPLKDFFARFQYRKPVGVISRLAATLRSDTGLGIMSNYVEFFTRKWLIGLVGSCYGEHCPLVLVFTGPQGTGKTEWFRRLLPEELRSYYAETKFDQGKDDEMLMCKKILLMNDEFGGNTIKESKKFKDLTSKQTFTLRKPYGKTHEDLRRLAVLAGTSNDEHILNDPTGNRRIIPINVLSIDHAAFNDIDKIDLLMEAYQAYQAGERHTLTSEHVSWLSEHTGRFEDLSLERELIEKFYSAPKYDGDINASFLSATEVKVFLEKETQQRVGLKRLAQELKRMTGKEAKVEWIANKSKRGYWLLTH